MPTILCYILNPCYDNSPWRSRKHNKDRDLDSHIEDTRGIEIGPNNDNESINSSDTMTAFGGSEADGHLGNLLHNGQANISMLVREINSLQQ